MDPKVFGVARKTVEDGLAELQAVKEAHDGGTKKLKLFKWDWIKFVQWVWCILKQVPPLIGAIGPFYKALKAFIASDHGAAALKTFLAAAETFMTQVEAIIPQFVKCGLPQ